MKKSFVTIATVVVIGLSSNLVANSVHAEPNIQKIESDRSEVQNKLSKAEAEIANVLKEIEELNKKITEVENALESNQQMIDDTNAKVKTTEEEIDTLQQEIEKRYEILSHRMVNYQKSGGNIGFLDVIFGSSSFTDFISRVTAVNKITSSDQELVDQLEADKAEVAEKLAELSDLQTELKGMQETILVQKADNEARKSELKEKEKTLQASINELEIEDSRLATLQAEANRQLAAERAASNPVASASTNASESNGTLTTLSKKESTKPVVSSNAIQTAINAGYPHIGTPYKWGGKGPGGFDCSGFVSWAYGQAGISLPSSTSAMQYSGTKVSYSNIKPGDLVFFNTYKTNGHVGIYIGNGKFIGSQDSGLGIADMTSGYWKNHFSGHVRRVAN